MQLDREDYQSQQTFRQNLDLDDMLLLCPKRPYAGLYVVGSDLNVHSNFQKSSHCQDIQRVFKSVP
jgi:hypothetical protein